MQKFFEKHPEQSLIALAIMFFALIVGYFMWGVVGAGDGIKSVFDAGKGGAGGTTFDFSGAKKLDFRGLIKE